MIRTKQERPADEANSPLSQREIKLLGLALEGCDVWAHGTAADFRKLNAKRPGLVTICKAMQDVPGHLQQPYFGVIVTRKGRRAYNIASVVVP